METINEILGYIVSKTIELNNVYLPGESVKINYSAIFCQNDTEYTRLNEEASKLGEVAEDTATGPLYKFTEPFQTVAGPLWLLKIRKPDMTRTQRGDADYTLDDYYSFKEKHIHHTEHFKLIDRDNFEMLELRDEKVDVLCYFSNIPLTEQLGIR